MSNTLRRLHWTEYCGQRDCTSDDEKYSSQVCEWLACHTVTCWCLLYLQRYLVNIQKWLWECICELLDRFGELVSADQWTLPDDVWTVLPTTIWDAVCNKWQVNAIHVLDEISCLNFDAIYVELCVVITVNETSTLACRHTSKLSSLVVHSYA